MGKDMTHFGTLVVISVLSLITKDRLLMSAAILLAVLMAADVKPALDTLQKTAFQIGIFFLMVFILLPIATQKISLANIGGRLVSLEGLCAVAAGIAISFIGGKGIGVLSSQPTIMLGVITGTLIAVLFLEGLPAGLIIAAGLFGIAQKL
jgi:uncharacterized membrane protein (DUF441 family)